MAILRQPEWPKVTVSVRYFAGAQAAAGVAEEQLTLPSPPAAPLTVRDLVSELAARRGPGLARILAISSFIVNEVTAGPEKPLADGARVDILPPFTGG
jgi:molybdopterin synthase sulfur carrier subunit